METLLEIMNDLERLCEIWKRHCHTEGFAKGRAKGWAEGFARGETKGFVKGKSEALVCLLIGRFGAAAFPLQERISRARLATLERWFKRAIFAPDLSSVFARN